MLTYKNQIRSVSRSTFMVRVCVCVYVFVCEYYRLMTVDNANEVEGVSS